MLAMEAQILAEVHQQPELSVDFVFEPYLTLL